MKQHLPKGAVYLLSMRVTPANNCFATGVYAELEKEIWDAIYRGVANHLGLALLDENYQTIPGYDVIIELGDQLGLKRPAEEFDGPNFMDYRLFILNDEIYLHANGDTVVVTRISLRSKGFSNSDVGIKDVANNYDGPWRADILPAEERHRFSFVKPYNLKNMYGGDNLQVTMMHQFSTIWSGGIYGKNYALFGVPNATHPDAPDSMYAEIDITQRHKVQQILVDEYVQLEKQYVYDRIWTPGTTKKRRVDLDRVNMRMVREVGNATISDDAPLPSFATVDEHWFPGREAPFKESGHGGACCISFSVNELNFGGTRNNHNESLLVGVAHTKTPWKPWYSKKKNEEKKERIPHTHYVSFVYAFDPYPPFQLRARSGYFCLGHVPLAKIEDDINPHSVLTRNRKLLQNKIEFDCPQMHYISAFIEKADDPSTTIIGYGLNDCTGRLVEVEKREIVRLLYPDPMDMIFEAT